MIFCTNMTDIYKLIVVISGCMFLLLTSGGILRILISKALSGTDMSFDNKARYTSLLIGKCENIITYLFIFINAETAIALIFTAKALIRKEDMKQNSLYFLAGTLVNISYSILIGTLFKFTVTKLM